MKNNFTKRPFGAPLHTKSKLYDVPVGFITLTPSHEEVVFAAAEWWLHVTQYRIICLVFETFAYM